MGDPAVAAFDPIFYLHHTNVDRLFSLWAAINPGVGVSDQVKNGVNLTASSALLPFWVAPNQIWPSEPIVASSNPLNYTYPEFVGFEAATPEELDRHVTEKVNKLYGDPMQNLAPAVPAPAPTKPAAPAPAPTKPAGSAPPPKPAAPGAVPAPATPEHKQDPAPNPQGPSRPPAPVATPAKPSPQPAPVKPTSPPSQVQVPPPTQQQPVQAPAPSHPSTKPPAKKPVDVSGTKWTARVRCNHHDLQGSFSIFLFVGDVPEDPKKWRRARSYAGADDVFLMGAETKKHCSNCQGSDAPPPAPLVSYVEGYVHLNDALKRAHLPSLEARVVAPFLQKNLHWRVKRANGEVVWLNSLEVVVIETSLARPRGSLHPIVGQPQKLNGVTHGRSGGARKE